MMKPIDSIRPSDSINATNSISNKSFIISSIIILITIASVTIISLRGEPAVISTNLEKLPMRILDFRATEDFFEQSVYAELNANLHIYRHYRSSDERQVDLYIGYYGTAKGGRTSHNPYSCLPSSGWGILDTRKVRLDVDYYNAGVEVNYILVQKGNIYETVLHWYQSAGTKVLDSGFKQNVQRFIERILRNRNDGAFVRISILTDKDGIEGSSLLLKKFAERVLNLLPQYWPIEQ